MSPYSSFSKLLFLLPAIFLAAVGELYALSDVSAVYNTGTEVPVTAAAVTATGATVTFSLNYAPATGTTLTVVNNTGLDFINGQFSNLAQGQTVTLSFGGISYNFVANYYGGTGNDLVLVWKNSRAFAWGYNSYGQLGNNSTTQSTVPAAVTATGVLMGKTIVAVAAGGQHSLALCSDGTLASWGNNNAGQLGNNSTTPSTVPVAVTTTGTVLAGKTVVAIATGLLHNVVLCSDGTLASWGYNVNGQLGNNSTTQSTVPVAVTTTGTVLAGKTVVAVAAGNSHNLALCSDGTLASWGYNGNGQLGNNSTTNSTVPVAVSTVGVLAGKTVAAMAAGVTHSFALCSDGTLAAWGRNDYGQLGNNSTTQSTVPVAVTTTGGVLASKTVVAVAGGFYYSLALCSDGTLASWGHNDYGQLGNNSTTDSTVPVAVNTAGALAGKTVAAVTAGGYHSVARCSDGTLASWGRNDYGQLGNNSTTQSTVPVVVDTSPLATGERFTFTASGQSAYHTLALVAASTSPTVTTLAATSITTTGAILNGTVNARDNSTAVSFDYGTSIAYGSSVAATPSPVIGSSNTAVTTTLTGLTPGTIYHYRAKGVNVAGTGTGSDRIFATALANVSAVYSAATDVPVTAAAVTATGATVTFSLIYAPVTGTTLTVVNNTGLDFINGQFSNLAQGQTVTLSFGGVNYDFVANYYGGTGNDLVLVWKNNRAFAWGYNNNGQLGNDNISNSSTPVAVTATGVLAGKTVLTVAAGSSHNLALCSDGTLAAWGSNGKGELGNNSTTDSAVPVAVYTGGVLAGKTIVAVAAGYNHSLALCSDGTLAAWGYNDFGQFGNNSTTESTVPVAVNPAGVLAGKTVVTIAAGNLYSLALCSDGTLAAWGNNGNGQLGNNSTMTSYLPATVTTTGVLAGKTVVTMSAGNSHSLALCSDGTLTAWGNNGNGQLGNNSTTQSTVPVAVTTTGVLAGKTVTSIATGSLHSVVLCSDGTLAAWGHNGFGQLGNNSTTQSTVPVAVTTTGVLAGKIVVAVTTGSNHSAVRCSDGTLASWGYNFYGQLGNNSTTQSTVPAAVDTSSFAAGESFLFAAGGRSAHHTLALVAAPQSPDVTTLAATSITTTDATLNGTVNARNYSAAVSFDYGTSIAYGSSIAATPSSVIGNSSTAVTSTLTGLSPGTAYHYRTKGVSVAGTSAGSDRIFATPLPDVSAVYSAATDVPVTAEAVTATGATVTFSLNYAPVTGTTLIVVNNTGLNFINGQFSNLTQGQTVTLSFGGVNYDFVANYYGGTGNDLVLVWKNSRAFAWGLNNYGQLGNNSTMDSLKPVAVMATGVLAGKTVVALAEGGNHSLALCSDGTLAACGWNGNGQLGNNSTTQSTVPVAVDTTGVLAGKIIVAVAAGPGHSLALCSDGTLAAWGYNSSGQLGDNSTTNSSVPVAVNTAGVLAGKSVVAVAAGGNHSMALCSDGTLAAWGYNGQGELGNNSITNSSVPVAVTTSGVLAGKFVVAMTAGFYHNLALCSDGTLAAWGYNSNGQLGNNSTTQRTVPVAVDTTGVLAGKSIVAITTGFYHNLVLCSDGTLAAWGYNGNGQLGNNSTTQRTVPVAVDTTGVLAGKSVVAVAGGYYHSLALCSDGTLAAWGYNSNGQLGNNSITSYAMPMAVDTSPLAAGERFILAASGKSSAHTLALVASPPPLPEVTTLAASSIINTGATLNGTVNARENSTVVSFDYGTSIAYGSSIAATPSPVTGSSPTNVTATLIGLAPGTVCHYRAKGVNAAGTITGSDQIFATPLSNVSAVYNTGTEVPVTAEAVTATGATVTFSLNYAPITGATLTVVNNTGLNFINGQFSNLTQGQGVMLSFGGVNYNFVANYYGGTGNDLELVWRDSRAFAWGWGSAGQLGNDDTSDNSTPVAVTATGVLAGKAVVAVAAGTFHSLALCSDGTLASWGWNNQGQLGNNSTTQSTVPVAVTTSGVLAGKTIVAVAAGYYHSLALCSDGTLASWGYNGQGQLGNNGNTQSTVPVAVNTSGVLAGKTIVAVAAGYSHSLVLCSDGTLASWGYNNNGQLGNNNTTNSNVPVAVNTAGVLAGKIVVAMTTGGNHSLALCSDGTLVSWGRNDQGQLGDNSTTSSSVPVAVSTMGALAGKTVGVVTAGNYHSLVLCSDGTLASWGYNGYGQLGNSNPASSSVPVEVTTTGVLAGKTVGAIAAGYDHNMALCSDGTLTAWGDNGNGQLGNNSTMSSSMPVNTSPLATGERFLFAASGPVAYHTLALVASPPSPAVTTLAASTITPTGATLNSAINARDNITTASFDYGTSIAYGNSIAATPSPVTGSNPAAGSTTLTGLNPGTVYHYRAKGVNVVGTGTGSDRIFATALPNVSAVYNTGTEVPVTAEAVTATGATVSFSLNYAPITGTTLTVVNNTGFDFINGQFSNLTQGQTVALGFGGVNYNFVVNYYGGTGNDLVLLWKDNRAFAWGYNNYGQLGNNSTTNSSVPVAVTATGLLAGKTVVAVAAGTSHCLALSSDGTLASWGYNNYGQLGNNSTTNNSVPVAVNTAGVLAGKTVVAVAAGASHSLALCSDGTMASWGYNNYGQLGNNSTTNSSVPVAVKITGSLAGRTIVAVAAGDSHSLALCSDGTLVAWGYNNYGQLGNNSYANSTVPVRIMTTEALAGKTIIAVAAGNSHSLALYSDGTLAAWGDNGSGQLGNNSNTPRRVPVSVSTVGVLAGKSVVSIAAGYNHSLALCSDGTLASWGYNNEGELGNNSTTQSTVPVAVNTAGILAGKTAVAIAAGAYHSMAVCSDGTMASWGYNSNGQLGNNSTTQSTVPVAVNTSPLATGEHFIQAAMGQLASHTLSLVATPPSPTVTTLAATSITTTDATLNGTVNARDNSTAVSFDYGTSIAYESSIAATPTPVTGSTPTAVTTTLTGLTPGTVYYYRVKGVSLAGTTNGTGLTFTTLTAQQAWRKTYFGSINNSGNAADAFDYDGDGLTNLTEWACGLNPTTASALATPIARNGSTLTFDYNRSVAAVNAGVSFSVKWSDTLAVGDWHPDNVTEEILSDNGTLQQVRATLPAGNLGRRFIQLQITAP